VQVDERYKIATPQDAANLVMMDMAYLDTEQMRVLLLDARGQLVEKVSLYQGTANSSVLRAAEVFRPAILCKCPGLIICHNHPSGDPEPSPKDRFQLPRWLIGIDEDGIFINPALLVRAEAVVATASNRPEVTKMTRLGPCMLTQFQDTICSIAHQVDGAERRANGGPG
jgi:hypothetical protein